MDNTSALTVVRSTMEMSSYITGFIDGEGSFLVSFSKRAKMSMGLEVRPAFTVSQHERNKGILIALRRFLRCGSVRFNKRDSTWKYEVRGLNDLLEKIVPHFDAFPLQTSKRSDFERFKRICFLMKSGSHLRHDGVRTIIELAYEMNNLGARRQNKSDLLRLIGKMKV